MTGNTVALLLGLHFVADFLLQSREMGKNKSSKPIVLLQHLSIQFVVFSLVLGVIYGPIQATGFALVNAMIHGVIDWNIWRGYKWFAAKRIYVDSEGVSHHSLIRGGEWCFWEDHWFYVTIGLDQLLHGLTLIYVARFFL